MAGGSHEFGRTNGGLNSKRHAVCDGTGKPVRLLLTKGRTSDDTVARCLLPTLPNANHLIADRSAAETLTSTSVVAMGPEVRDNVEQPCRMHEWGYG